MKNKYILDIFKNQTIKIMNNLTIFVGNMTYYFSEEISQQPSRFGTLMGALFAFIFIFFGFLSALFIIAAILINKKMRNNPTNIFIVSLQLNDIWNMCFNQFLVGLSYAFQNWFGPFLICEVCVYSSIICTGCLLWHHALISIHRYLVVVLNQTVSYMNMSPKVYTNLNLIIARVIPIGVCLPALIDRNMVVYNKKALRCLLAPNISRLQNLLIVVFNMLLPCAIIIACFIRIFSYVSTASKNVSTNKSARYSSKSKTNMSNPSISINYSNKQLNVNSFKLHKPKSTNEREIEISKMFAVIFTVFMFGYLPYGFIRLMDKNNNLHADVYIVLTMLFIISISVSPVIYGLMNRQIRQHCVGLFYLICSCGEKKPNGVDKLLVKSSKGLTEKKLILMSSLPSLRRDFQDSEVIQEGLALKKDGEHEGINYLTMI